MGPGLHLLYALSGATALLYEVVWTRLLTLELGHTTASAGAVLAAFMGGLALGALAAGRWAPRLEPAVALRVYAMLEFAIAALALAVPLEISALHPLLARAYGDGPGGLVFQALRVSSALVIVGLPALLMGATYPLVILEGRAAGSLYAANTAGAALGTVLTGFVLLPRVGMFRATLVGVAGNVLVALLATRRFNTEVQHEGSTRRFKTKVQPGGSGSSVDNLTVPLLVTAVCGFAALALEIAWTRALAMVMGPTTYGFTTTVACYIVGLALGSGVAAWLLRNRESRGQPVLWLALVLGAAAVTIAWSIGRVDDLVLDVARRTTQQDVTYFRLLAAELVGAASLLIPQAICFGAAFPLVLAFAAATSRREAGFLYAANTLGAIAGSLAASALLIPRFGLRGTFLVSAALVGVTSVTLAARYLRAQRPLVVAATLALAATATLLGTAGWNVALLSSGAYKYAAYLGEQDLEVRLTAGTLRYYREGPSGTVSVRDVAGVRTLSIDGKVDASNGGDMLTERLLAHIPLLLHPGAVRVAIVGLGSGVTVGSALTYPSAEIDVIEISPEVVEASAWFADENRRALSDSRVRLIRGDARTHFRLASSRYDVIVSEPSNPWMAGVAALFTREFFEAMRSRLAPGGVVCQWAHAYDIASDDLKSIGATFSAVFPHVMLWLVGEGDLLLVGSERPFSDSGPLPAPAEHARNDLAAAGVTDPAVLELLRIGGRAAIEPWMAGANLQTDDRMALEFSVPAAIVGRSRDDNATALLRLARQTDGWDALVLRDAGLLALRAQAPNRAWTLLTAAATRLPDDRVTLDALVQAAAMAADGERLDAVESHLRSSMAARPASVAPRLELARLLAARGDYEEARRLALDAERVAPGDGDVQQQLAAIAADAGDAEGLQRALAQLRSLRPKAATTSYFEGVLRTLTGDPGSAVPFARDAVTADPRYAAAWNLLGSSLAAGRQSADEIRNAFTRAVRAEPSDPAAYVNLGTLELSSGRPTAAANWFAQALTIDPNHQEARKGLERARAAIE